MPVQGLFFAATRPRRWSASAAGLLAVGLLALCLPAPAAAAETLVPIDGNPSCATLNASSDPAFASITGDFGFKLNSPSSGTFTLTNPPGELTGGAPSDPSNSVTLTFSNTALGEVFNWAATLGIDAVIVKGGDGANAYVYVPESTSGTGLHAPLNSSGTYAGVSHVEFCYDYELTVAKTAATTFTRTFGWTIDKSVDPATHDLETGQSDDSEYTVSVTKDAGTDSGWAVSGTITIDNDTPFPATITSVTDVISGGLNATVNCGVLFPHLLAAGGTLECTYSRALPDGTARVNTATASTTGAVGTGSGTANVVFGNPTTVVNNSINVDDTNGLSWPFSSSGSQTYTRTFTCDEDEGQHDNTATIRETGQSDDASVVVTCTPPPPQDTGKIVVVKFFDANMNGVRDPGEQLLPNWQILISGNGVHPTPVDIGVDVGAYTVTEGTPVEPGWVATTPTSVNVVIEPDEIETVEFGNVCFAGGGGHTIGFWSNKNGQALVDAADLQALRDLNLRNADGTAFDPATYSQLKAWLSKATATNMAYMLSAQLAAMTLNVRNGFVDPAAVISAPGTTSADANDLATVAEIMAEANGSLATYGSTPTGHAQRAHQEALKTALDNANNNLSFVQNQPCSYTFAP